MPKDEGLNTDIWISNDPPADPGTALPAVQIGVNFREAVVSGPPAALAAVKAELSCDVRDFRADPFGRATVPLEFFHEDPRRRLHLSPGTAHRAEAAADVAGWTTHVVDHRHFAPELMPDAEVVAGLVGGDADLARAVRECPRGQVEVRDDADLLDRVLLLCQLFPRLNVLIMVRNSGRARKIWHALRGALGKKVQLAHGNWEKDARVVVCPFTHVRDASVWHLVLLPDTAALAGDAVSKKVAAAAGLTNFSIEEGLPTRVYAFPRSEPRPGRRAELAVEVASGPVIFALQPPALPVTVDFVALGSVIRTVGLHGLDYKRRVYWANDERNRRVSAVAHAVANGALSALWQMGVLLAAPEDLFGRLGHPLRAVIVVESTEHAARLHRLLPGWERRDLNGNNAGRRAKLTVMTAAYVEAYGMEADVVIRADGGGRLGLKGFPLPRRQSGNNPAVLLDFDDLFDGRSREASRRRRSDYQQCGWTVSKPAAKPHRFASDRQPHDSVPPRSHTRPTANPPDRRRDGPPPTSGKDGQNRLINAATGVTPTPDAKPVPGNGKKGVTPTNVEANLSKAAPGITSPNAASYHTDGKEDLLNSEAGK